MMLVAEGVTLSYPGRTLCHGLDLAVRPGECWAVLGNNGSGKSTLLHTLGGVRSAQTGRVLLDGLPLCDYSAAGRAKRVGLLLQEEAPTFWGSVLEYVMLGRYPHRHWLAGHSLEDEQRARASLACLDLSALEARVWTTLSGGERQRARLALTLTQDPAVLLLDEPLQHLDLRHRRQAMGLLQGLAREGGKAVVCVLHEVMLARRFCDHALLLFDDGKARAGAARELLMRPVLEELFGCPLED
jgi:iron complex transport system ATP-binding protein